MGVKVGWRRFSVSLSEADYAQLQALCRYYKFSLDKGAAQVLQSYLQTQRGKEQYGRNSG